MEKSNVLVQSITDGAYDELLARRYGAEKLERQKARYINLINEWQAIYGRGRKCEVISVPYSVLLAGDGADLAIPTDIDLLAVVDTNHTNVSRIRCVNYLGEDLPDLFQHGPYTLEADFTVGVIRGVQQAFKALGYRKPKGIFQTCFDLYLDGVTLPGQGLDEAGHLAMLIAYIINRHTMEGRLSEKQLAEIVQYALANYVKIDSYATDVYATLRGKAVTGDFTDAEAEVIAEKEIDMCGTGMYLVNIGTTDINIHDHEIDPRLDAFLTKLNRDVENLPEKEFYEILAAMEDVDKEAAIFLLDYYTQENFGKIYAENAEDGTGSPSVETTLEDEKESLAGAAKWHCKVNQPFWMTLCCVGHEAKETFTTAMEKLFGEGCVETVGFATGETKVII